MFPTNENLNIKDLKLLMETYNNMIEINKHLYQQQIMAIDLSKTLLKKEEETSKDHAVLYNNINTLLSNVEKNINDIRVINSKLETIKNELSLQHSGISNKIYMGVIGMGTIIIGLIGLVANLMIKNNLIEKMYELLVNMSSKGVGL